MRVLLAALLLIAALAGPVPSAPDVGGLEGRRPGGSRATLGARG